LEAKCKSLKRMLRFLCSDDVDGGVVASSSSDPG